MISLEEDKQLKGMAEIYIRVKRWGYIPENLTFENYCQMSKVEFNDSFYIKESTY